MNIEELEKSNYIIYSYIAGSHSYGLNTPESDIDRRGCYILPLKERISLMNFDQEISSSKQDIKYYDIKKFMKLSSDCNPALIESLFTPKDCIEICTPQMQKLIDNRHLFISKRAYNTFSGYAYAQISKCKGQNKLVHNPKPKEPPEQEDFCWVIPIDESRLSENNARKYNKYRLQFNSIPELESQMRKTPCRPILLKDAELGTLAQYHVAALEHVSNTYRLYYYGDDNARGVFRGDGMLVCESIPLKDEAKRFVGLLIYNKHEYEKALREWKQYWEWIKDRNPDRWMDQENKTVDYDAKNMLHCFRLLYSGKNVLTNGSPIVRFEGEKREFLLNIRKGKYSYEELMSLVEREMKELDELKEKSTLPWGANIKAINQLYQEIIGIK